MHPALLIDLYQLTMAQAYFDRAMDAPAVFEVAVRTIPPSRRFLVAAGLEQAVQYLENLQFDAEDLRYLDSLGRFSRRFLDHLATVRFTGSVHAVPEGTAFFAQEPILRVTAPLLEAQLVESRLLNILHFQTLVASKAVRCLLAARGRTLIDFGMRRAHEADAAVFAARATFLSGFDGTATVEAGRRFGIPLSGTMAHSFVEAHDQEQDAFQHFVNSCPDHVTLLIDTYDTQRAARRVGALARELAARGRPGAIHAVRIDSGDLHHEVRKVREILDDAGQPKIQIIVSGGLDEYKVDRLVRDRVPVDGFGVGTALVVSDDVPALDMAYKLQEYAGVPRRKRSPGKVTWPGVRQVFRERGAEGRMTGDCICLEAETASGSPLLTEVMRAGRRAVDVPTVARAREACRREIEALPDGLRRLDAADDEWPVRISAGLQRMAAALDAAGD